MVLLDDVLDRLTALPPAEERESFLRFVAASGDRSLRREGGPEHVTASCFVFSTDLARTLLCFHRKGRFWVQFGGHLEPDDATVADAAVREAREESGIGRLALLSGSIVDLERHELHGGFSCDAHWDIGFVALLSGDEEVTVSAESEDVRWFPLDDLPEDTADGLVRRLSTARTAAELMLA